MVVTVDSKGAKLCSSTPHSQHATDQVQCARQSMIPEVSDQVASDVVAQKNRSPQLGFQNTKTCSVAQSLIQVQNTLSLV